MAGDWRTTAIDRIRALVLEAEPGMIEEAKWVKSSNPAGVPTWSRDGIVCTGEVYKDKVKVTFAQGAALEDPAKLFNSSLDGKTRRAIDLSEGDVLDADAFKDLVRAAVAHNARRSKR